MSSKLKSINELYEETIQLVSSDSEIWQSFLKCASMNYKYNFSEQLLIFAQKPSAISCAELETWNKSLNRWVNKGAKGIALLDETNGYLKLKYVFDVADTHSRYGKDISLWKVDKIYENQIVEALENKYGILENKDNFSEALKSVSSNLTEDNYSDYLNDLINNKSNTQLEKVDDEIIELWYKSLLSNSISLMIMNRCGINPNFTHQDFIEIRNFNDINTITRLGSAVSQIAEMGLREIYSTLKKIRISEIEKNRTFDKSVKMLYDNAQDEKRTERSDNYEYNLSKNRGLSTTKPNIGKQEGKAVGEIFSNEATVSEREQARVLSNSINEESIDATFDRDSETVRSSVRRINSTNEENEEHNRGNEINRPNEVGWDDEQHQDDSRRNSVERDNLQLNIYKPSVNATYYVVTDEKINQILSTTPHLKKTNIEIVNYFEKEKDTSERTQFIRSVFNSDYTGIMIDDEMFGYKTFDNGVLFWKGNFLSRDTESFVEWKDLVHHYRAMIILKQLNSKSHTKEKEQLTLFEEEKFVPNELEFTDEFVDEFLQTSFSGTNGKYEIYEKFTKELSNVEKVAFLKKEYGSTYLGGSHTITGSGIGYNCDSKGIEFNRGYFGKSARRKLFNWNYIVNRINKSIRQDKYLNEKEKEGYELWLENKNINNDFEVQEDKSLEEENSDVIEEFDLEQESDDVTPIPTEKNISDLTFKKKQNVGESDLHPEIPYNERINYKITDNNLGVGTAKERFKNNIEAIKVLKRCEVEDRYATAKEQEILSKYVGWGGLSQAFDVHNTSWENEYNELKELLTTEEYEQAMETTLTAFYTPPVVIKSMYKALENMGLEKGNILEPSCGIGNFIGLLPNNDNLKIYGVEIDSISGRIARQLYQKSSIAIKGFEETNYSDSFFDVAIGNVPFGNYKVADKRYDKNNFLIHDYFFAKSLDKVRPGGIIALITSKGTLDKENPNFRKYLSQRADLLGAIRLPNDVFKNSAETEVTTDIIFLQKRDAITDVEPNWVHLGTTSDGITMNNYFIDNPQNVLGSMKNVTTQYGLDTACIPFDNENLEDLLNDAIANIHAEIKEYQLEDIGEEEDLSIEAEVNVKNFSYALINDKIYYRENSRMYPQDLALTTENRIKGLIEIRDCTRELINLQLEDAPDELIKQEQTKLNDLYDKFTKKYGLINNRANSSAFSNDNSYFLLCSLEILNENGDLLRKADIFSKRTIRPHIEVKRANNANEALILSISERAKVDMDYMRSLLNKSEEEIFQELDGEIFILPTETDERVYVSANEYLTGNVREKLREAEYYNSINPIFDKNIEYLKKVIPEEIKTSEIGLRLGATWIPAEEIQSFISELLDLSYFGSLKLKVHYSELNGEWNIEGKHIEKNSVAVTTTYGTNRANAYRLLEDALNLRDTRIFDYKINEEGKRVEILNKKETAIAQAKQEQIRQAFQDWVWKEPKRREKLTVLYNDIFNAIRPREYDGSHIKFVGMNPEIKLREHQANAIARILYGGNTLLAHEVGAGKTFEMVAAAMESKRLGLCNKSLFVVPNHIIEQFASEFLQLYPSANILVSTKKDFETSNRKKFCSRIATGDYDAIIIGHSQFEKIPMSIKRQEEILKQQLQETIKGIIELKENGGERFSIKMMMRTKKAIERKLEKLNNRDKKDDVITFEELGVDRLFIDEAHYYKNLYLYTKMRNVGGISQTESQKSSDLFMKCRYLDELTNNKGTIFATGTPISNSMVELYTMQRYLQYDTLLKHRLQHFDAWASTFGETVTAIELAPEGTGYRAKTRFAKFYNIPELMSMFREVADIKTADTLNLPVPKAHYTNVVVKPSEIQLEMVKTFAERAEKVRKKEVDATEDNMLKITNDGRKLALDQRLIDELLPDEENSKISACAENVYKIWEENKDKKLTQLIFCDLSTPKGDGSFNVYDDMKKKLIERGVPAQDIEFIHNAHNEIKKKELFSKVRKGQVRTLMGSTSKMGAGTNCQDKLIALHDLDCPWRPSDLIQRSGRIVRQGNQNSDVYIYRYVTEKTFDAYLYQLVENKQKFISQIMTSKVPVRSAEDIDEVALSYAEIKALAAGNPLIIEKTQLDSEVSKLRLLKQSHMNQKFELEDKVNNYYPNQIKSLEKNIKNYELDIEHLELNFPMDGEVFSPMIIKDIKYTDKKEACEKLLEYCMYNITSKPSEIGEYKGFKIEVWYDNFYHKHKLSLTKNSSIVIEIGNSEIGNLTRIDNALGNLPKKLEESKELLSTTKVQINKAKEGMTKPFPQEQELIEKSRRLDELNIKLNLNERTNEIIDDNESQELEEIQVYKDDYER